MTTLVITHGSGQLGNRLITHCHVLAYAIEHQMRFVNLGLTEYRSLFESYRSRLLISHPRSMPGFETWAPTVDERFRRLLLMLSNARFFKNSIKRIELPYLQRSSLETPEHQQIVNSSRICLLTGLKFLHPHLVRKHNERIRSIMKLHGAQNPEDASPERPKGTAILGCHIRQGDYATWRKGEFYFESTEYARMLHELSDRIGPDSKILVFSNVKQDPSVFSGLNVEFRRGSISRDLEDMMGCDYLVGPPSSFSLWASFAGNVPLAFMSKDFKCPSAESFIIRDDLMYDY